MFSDSAKNIGVLACLHFHVERAPGGGLEATPRVQKEEGLVGREREGGRQ